MNRWLLFIILLSFLLSSCFDDPKGTKGRARLSAGSGTTVVETQICTEAQFVNNLGNKCFQGACPSDHHLVTSQTELNNVLEIFDTQISPTLTQEEDSKRRDNFFRARGLCNAGATPSRPTNEINIVEDVCICQNRQALSLNNCASVCSARGADTNATLIINTRPSAAILNDPRFITNGQTQGNLNSWCNATIDDGRTNPACTVQIFNGSNTFVLSENLKFEQQNTISVRVPNSLTDNVTYLGRIVESGSGSNAKSIPFQFRLKRNLTQTVSALTPLKIEPMKMYSCIARTFSAVSERLPATGSYHSAFRLSMFEQLGRTPAVVSNTNSLTIFCHDYQLSGKNDSSSYGRLESFSHVFSLWDADDNRFTLSGGGLEINNFIHQRLLSEYNLSDSTNYFSPFYGGEDGARYHPSIKNSTIQGFLLTAFQDDLNGAAYCPNSAHYNSTVPKFKILKEIVGVETEGLFLGVMTPKVLSAADFAASQIVTDIIYLRESLVNQIWFYTEQNTNLRPNSSTAHTKKLKFYWPPDFSAPLVKKVWQEEYQILEPSEASLLIQSATDTRNDGGIAEIPSVMRTSDKRLGCVPKE